MSKEIIAAEVTNINGVATLQGLEGIFENLITSLLGLGGILLFIYLIMGGIKYITAGGNPKNVESAQNTLTFAVLGIIAVALSFLVLKFLGVITGNLNILNFQITIF